MTVSKRLKQKEEELNTIKGQCAKLMEYLKRNHKTVYDEIKEKKNRGINLFEDNTSFAFVNVSTPAPAPAPAPAQTIMLNDDSSSGEEEIIEEGQI